MSKVPYARTFLRGAVRNHAGRQLLPWVHIAEASPCETQCEALETAWSISSSAFKLALCALGPGPRVLCQLEDNLCFGEQVNSTRTDCPGTAFGPSKETEVSFRLQFGSICSALRWIGCVLSVALMAGVSACSGEGGQEWCPPAACSRARSPAPCAFVQGISAQTTQAVISRRVPVHRTSVNNPHATCDPGDVTRWESLLPRERRYFHSPHL